jgi:hypothetical protein
VSLINKRKEMRFAGKGHNTILEIVNPAEYTSSAVDVIRRHVPENGGT